MKGVFERFPMIPHHPTSPFTSETLHKLPDFPSEERNLILYGPPGTGKTYLMQQWAQRYFTDDHPNPPLTDALRTLARTLSWWQVLALALLDSGKPVKVRELYHHPLVRARVEQASFSRNVRALIWSTLQLHTAEHCPQVNVSRRYHPTIFWKDEQSRWQVVMERLEIRAPELLEIYDDLQTLKRTQPMATRYAFVTFHPSYSYEDFVEGIRPVTDEETGLLRYEVRPGIFKQLVRRALEHPDQSFALFIDEINRGNLAHIFGELITLIEPDKRSGNPHALSITLPYSGESFTIPRNLYLIGAMNTADRSIAVFDVALRRRFTFYPLYPQREWVEASVGERGNLRTPSGNVLNVAHLFETLNQRIEILYDREHTLGHSYFMGIHSLIELRNRFLTDILPLLEEYFYNEGKKICQVLGAPVTPEGKQTNPYPILQALLPADPVLTTESWSSISSVYYRLHPTFASATTEDELFPFFAHLIGKSL